MVEIKTAGTLGYCVGVAQAIEKAVAFGQQTKKAFSLGTVAHNEGVVEMLRTFGVEPTTEDQLLGGENVIISAHGASPDTFEHLRSLNCISQDCTCQYVWKSQQMVEKLAVEGYDVVIFGDPRHQEVIGLRGWAHGGAMFIGGEQNLFTKEQGTANLHLGKRIGVVSQTTRDPQHYAEFISMLMHNLHNDYWEIRVANTICPIVANRIEQTKNLAKIVDLMLVVGSRESANTMNLAAASMRDFVPNFDLPPQQRTFIVANDRDEEAWKPVQLYLTNWFESDDIIGQLHIGITAGTSTPQLVVDNVIAKVKELTNGH